MKTTSINIEGQILSPEIIDRLDSTDLLGQNPKDYGLGKNVKLKDEIATAWANAKDQWNIFKRRTEKLSDEDTGTTETRKYFIIPLLEFLGYNISVSKAEEINGNSFAISHRDQKIEGFPVIIVGLNDSLDKKRESGGLRLSPHALMQEYLNITEHLYGIVTNGHSLRVLRDSGKLIRLTYLEFDLLRMMEDDLFAEFSIMYRLIHASRMPQKFGEGDSSIIEQYHQLSLEAGARIRDNLSGAVEKSIKVIADGFLKHSANDELREKIETKQINAAELFQYLLRFIYRVLFLMVIEERNIIYPDRGDKEQDYYREIYYKYYSISRIRKLSDNIFYFDEKLDDLWIALRNTFKIFGNERLAAKLGIYPLNGDLFDFDSLGILSDSNLDNHSLLECIRNLSVFENPETKSLIRVNYGALNVEEFGSVYEGLLEKDPVINNVSDEISFNLVKGGERSSSGSHYTPEELVQPLIKHSLDYVIEDKLKNAESPPFNKVGKQGGSKEDLLKAKEEALLSIKVCDVACGSGHILLSAARRIAQELTRLRTGEDQPSPEPFREATRDVINNCIYGVDKNPLAVELCKVALWLEAHNPGMPLNFLDNKIRCGDSIVGLARIEELQKGIATEAFKTLPEDDKTIASGFRKKNKEELQNRDQYTLTDKEEVIEKLNNISVKFKSFNELPDNTVEAVRKKAEEFDVLKGTDWRHLKEAADLQVAQFFIPKDSSNKNFLTTDREYFRVLAGDKAKHERQISTARAVGAEKKFFHWFLEFPEVFAGSEHPERSEGSIGGFDCILGNPPFLGGQRLTGTFGNNFLEWVKTEFAPAGSCDLVTYFFRRIFDLLSLNGFQALISTNTIAQGGAREGGLEVIVKENGVINFAIRSMRWPGTAAVEVSLVAIQKGEWKKERFLGNERVDFISPYLDDTEVIGDPYQLKQNEGKSFQGSIVLGKGFVLEPKEAKRLIEKDSNNKDVLFPYLNGEDLNTNPDQSPNRWVINFFDWPLRRAELDEWNELTKEEKEKARKERIIAPPDYRNKVASDYPDCLFIVERDVKPERLENNDKGARKKWWQFLRMRGELYSTISGMERVLVTSEVTKYCGFSYSESNLIFMHTLKIVVLSIYKSFLILNSSAQEYWGWKYSSTMGGVGLRYILKAAFETFPFPQNITKETEAELEKIGEEYHEFRRQLMLDLQLGLTKTYNLFHNPECNSNNIEKAKDITEFKRANLQIQIEEAIKKIEKLRELHKQMDEAVLKAYDWTDIDLAHDFYEVDYLPENDRVRYTISPEARKEVLKRLLELNHKIHEEEVKAGLWDKGKSKGKSKKKKVKDGGGLFGE